MTTNIFNQELKYLSQIFREKRNILLFVDNCSAYQILHKFQNIKVEYLPVNSRSVLQPLNQGVIRSLKHFLKYNLTKYMITIIEYGRKFKKNYNFQVDTSLI